MSDAAAQDESKAVTMFASAVIRSLATCLDLTTKDEDRDEKLKFSVAEPGPQSTEVTEQRRSVRLESRILWLVIASPTQLDIP